MGETDKKAKGAKMGCDIHAYVEVKCNDGWQYKGSVFDYRDYGLFGFLADVRNYSMVPTLVQPRGLPTDNSDVVSQEYEDWYGDGHTPSWLLLRELVDFDYNQQFEDRRVTRQTAPNCWDGGCTADPGGGAVTTYREFLGDYYMKELERLRTLGEPDAVRIVFWFDN